MKHEKPSEVPPTGYIRINRHIMPENGREFFNFTCWNGKGWESYGVEKFKKGEIDELFRARTNSSGEIVNRY